MIEAILLGLSLINSYCLFWLYVHYKETLTLIEHHSYFIELLDYNNLSLELSTRENGPSLEEEATLHTMELNLKEKAEDLGLHIHFPERPPSLED